MVDDKTAPEKFGDKDLCALQGYIDFYGRVAIPYSTPPNIGGRAAYMPPNIGVQAPRFDAVTST